MTNASMSESGFFIQSDLTWHTSILLSVIPEATKSPALQSERAYSGAGKALHSNKNEFVTTPEQIVTGSTPGLVEGSIFR